jgi:hypothetical protein
MLLVFPLTTRHHLQAAVDGSMSASFSRIIVVRFDVTLATQLSFVCVHCVLGVPFYPRGYPMEERWPKVEWHPIIISTLDFD